MPKRAQRKVVKSMGARRDNGNYKIPNQSSAMVKAPQTIQKDSKKPKVAKGGDLRAKGN
jgi:hypothetical protein